MRCYTFVRLLIVLAAWLALGGCSWIPGFAEKDFPENWGAREYYEQAKKELDRRNYERAINLYEALEARYPFGPYAEQAQLEIGYAYYRYDEPQQAIAACDRYIKLHPQNPKAAYAYYLKGLVNFNLVLGLVRRFVPTDITQRDPGASRDAFRDFTVVVDRYPESRYAEDARLRLIYLRNNIAQHEVNVARYYMRRRAYLAAANRANEVIVKFQGTPAVPKALVLMEAAYRELGMEQLADDAARVMAQNYPDGVDSVATRGVTTTERMWNWFGLDQ